MLLRSASIDARLTAARLAALLGERDILRDDAARDIDVRLRIDLLARGAHGQSDAGALRRIRAEADRLARQQHVAHDGDDDRGAAGLLIALAYPDRIAQRRGGRGRYVMRNGRGANVDPSDPLGGEEFLAIAAVDDRPPSSKVFLAAPLLRDELERHFARHIVNDRIVEWDERSQSVVARQRVTLGAIVLRDDPVRDVDPTETAAVLARVLTAKGVTSLPWNDAARGLRARLAFLHRVDPAWPDVSDAGLAQSIDAWLAPRLIGLRRLAEVERLDLGAALLHQLSWQQRAALDELAPTHFTVPSGSRLPIDYEDPEAPVLAVRLQEMFGSAETPRIAAGRVPLTLHLLSPAHRPLQVTRDLAGFWKTSYFDVRREMRGRYPKHPWPEDPLGALPTNRAKRRGE
jgi:ATP-dependent helicase HrpB